MLIGRGSKRPSLDTVRRIKRALYEALTLPDDAMITVSELACLEEGCSPVETVIGLLRPNAPQLQYKIHKATEAIDADDLRQVCTTWGFDVQTTTLTRFKQENR